MYSFEPHEMTQEEKRIIEEKIKNGQTENVLILKMDGDQLKGVTHDT